MATNMDKGLYQAPQGLQEESAIEIEIEDPKSIGIQTPDGSVIIDFGDQEDAKDDDFSANLAEFVPDNELSGLVTELVDAYTQDKNSRKDWEKPIAEGLNLLGLKIEDRTEPWAGACGVVHPILTEACVKFQSEMIMETFPASGPVLTKILGDITEEKEKSAARVREDMNWQLTENMPEYRSEHERMLWNLGYAGSAFKKVYFDPAMGRQVAMFVPAEEVVIPYGSTETNFCGRLTHVMKKTENEARKLQVSGFYRDVEFGPPLKEMQDIARRKDRLTGSSPIDDDRLTFYEFHVELDLPGFEDKDEDGEETGVALPYVVTIDPSGQNVLSIYRNWNPDDKKRIARDHFIHYILFPGFGAYGMGYVHLLGGFAKGATSTLRQLVDAGTLNNLPGGLKARGMRIKGDDTPIAPGEFRDVDIPSGTVRDNIMPLPYKEPSATLFQLLGSVVEEGRRLASISDMAIGEMNSQAPVGTTLALLERSMKVMSAASARVHNAMRKEFKLLKKIIEDYTPKEYSYEDGATRRAKKFDYKHVDIIPISDPNASSMAHRVTQYQAALQLAASAPGIYDMPMLHRQILEILGIKNANKLVPDKENTEPTDPVTENMNMLRSKPAKAFVFQDHKAHLTVHMSAANDPKIKQIVGQSPQANQIQGALMAHVMEHVAFAYRQEIEKQLGTSLPAEEKILPEEVEVQLSRLTAQAAQRLLTSNQNESAQQQADQTAQDPIFQLQQKEMQIKEAEVQRKAAADAANNQLREKELASKTQLESARIAMQNQQEQSRQANKNRNDEQNRLSDAQIAVLKQMSGANRDQPKS